MFKQATEAYSKGEYDKAINGYEKILEIVPEFGAVYNYLALAHKEKGTDIDEVIWLFKKAIQFKPDFSQPYDHLAKIYYSMAEYDLAEKYGAKAVEIKPDLVTARLTLAWTYLLGKKQASDAIPHFEHVLKKNDFTYAQYGLGMAYSMSQESFRVLEMITALRDKGEENLATQLESMIRGGSYSHPPEIKKAPVPRSKRVRGQLVENELPSYASESQNVPVRVKDKSPKPSSSSSLNDQWGKVFSTPAQTSKPSPPPEAPPPPKKKSKPKGSGFW